MVKFPLRIVLFFSPTTLPYVRVPLAVVMLELSVKVFGIGTIANMIFRTFVPVIFLVMASFFLPAMQGDV